MKMQQMLIFSYYLQFHYGESVFSSCLIDMKSKNNVSTPHFLGEKSRRGCGRKVSTVVDAGFILKTFNFA